MADGNPIGTDPRTCLFEEGVPRLTRGILQRQPPRARQRPYIAAADLQWAFQTRRDLGAESGVGFRCGSSQAMVEVREPNQPQRTRLLRVMQQPGQRD
jgi:hypothetical protein